MRELKVEGKVLAKYERATKKPKGYEWAKYKVVQPDGSVRYTETLSEVAWLAAQAETADERNALHEKYDRIKTKAINRLLKKVR